MKKFKNCPLYFREGGKTQTKRKGLIMWETIKEIKEIWWPEKKKTYPEAKRSDFTGLEVLTRVNGKIAYRVLHEADAIGLAQHCYQTPVRVDAQEELVGYTIKIHKDLY